MEYETLLEKQNWVCAVCLSPETMVDKRSGKTRRLAVDHNHATGMVRGLLCCACNQTIGRLKENPDTLRRLADYLEMWSSI